MRYKWIGALACLLAVLLSLVDYDAVLFHQAQTRYHQHREAAEKPACTAHPDGELCTHLPLILIDTGGVEIPGKGLVDENGEHIGFLTAADGAEKINAHIAVVDSETQNNHPSDPPTSSGEALIRARGHSSRYFDKLGYLVQFTDEAGLTLLGMDAHQEWALHGPILDRTLIRNYMWYNIAGEIMDYAPNVRFCELLLNGEYQGVYVATETITAGKGGSRLSITKRAKGNAYGGYLLRIDWPKEERLDTFSAYTLRNRNAMRIQYPASPSEALERAIKDDFSSFEKALYSYDYDSKRYGYANWIDLDSFVDYFLINELTLNYDAGNLSTYVYKDVDGKLRMCVWDFNSACDNYQEAPAAAERFALQNRPWYFMLTKDEDFTDRIVKRYRALRKTFLSDAYLMDYIDQTVAYLGPAVARNNERWEFAFKKEANRLLPAERNPSTYEEAIASLKESIRTRAAWMDTHIETLRQYSAESKVKKYNENAD